MNNGGDIEVPYLRNLDNAEIIVRELNLFLRGQEGARTMANGILPYLRFVVSVRGVVGPRSLKEYKEVLDRNSTVGVNTKSQKFGLTRAFVRSLMAAKVIGSAALPKNFKMEDPKHKVTFIDSCRYRLAEVTESVSNDVQYWQEKLNIELAEAQSLAFGLACMDAIQEFAKKEIERYEADCRYVDKLIQSITDEDALALKQLEAERVRRSPEQIIKWLYVHYGRALPAGEDGGLECILGWWRKQPNGWSVVRVRSAFFPTAKSLDSYFLLGLAHEKLCPNVDGLRLYTYLDCCRPAFERGFVDVFCGKRRGGSEPVALPKDDFLVKAFSSLAVRVKTLLPELPGGPEHLQQECPELFVTYTPAAGRAVTARSLDPSSPANMVRRFLRGAVKSYPVLKPLVGTVTGENFRPTHAYLKKLAGKSIYEIKRDLHHRNTSTTRGYVEGVETQAIQLRRQRDFQRYLLDQVDLEAKRTGSGYVCASEDEEQVGCVKLLKCSDCEAKRIVFESVEIVAEWLAWEKYLTEQKLRLKLENEERWEKVWMPKLVEYQALIGQTKSRQLQDARGRMDEVVLPWIS
ncbi:hypothetical protein [Zhongshania sp. BJYM1]|uniref:hypothetical protein n=1 Tax=Zhongshania aquatica TaxID=2965069 RepID=UPI0022B4B0E5|nr:hypothetical protein [Marortus sp. BJYM1]